MRDAPWTSYENKRNDEAMCMLTSKHFAVIPEDSLCMEQTSSDVNVQIRIFSSMNIMTVYHLHFHDSGVTRSINKYFIQRK